MRPAAFAFLLLSAFTLAANAAPNDGLTGADARVEIGRSQFSVSGTLPRVSADDHGQAIKVLGEAFAVHGRLGLSAGKVSGTDLLSAGDSLMGGKTSVLFGLGGEYRPQPNVALTLNVDSDGKVSNKAQAGALVFGLHVTL